MSASVERLQVRRPFDWEGLLSFFAPRAIPGVEAIEEGLLQRSFRQGAQVGHLEVRYDGELVVRTWGGVPKGELARRVLDVDAPVDEIQKRFSADPVIGPLLERWPGIRLPGAWDGFEMGVRAILGQQVSVKAAHTLAGRLVAKFGRQTNSPFPRVDRVFPLAQELAGVEVEELASIGLTRKRAETLHHFAVWSALPEGERGRLIELPGIGPWTESYLRMRGSSDRDAFPAGDLGVQKALGISGLGPVKAAREAEAKSQAWRPLRAYAVFLLWRS